MQKQHRAMMKWVGALLTVAAMVGVVAIVVVLWPLLLHVSVTTAAAKAVAVITPAVAKP